MMGIITGSIVVTHMIYTYDGNNHWKHSCYTYVYPVIIVFFILVNETGPLTLPKLLRLPMNWQYF